MNTDDLILGIKPKNSELNCKALFDDSTKYLVGTVGCNNKSIESGSLVESILPVEEKEKILAGETQLTYNGISIELIPSEKKEEENNVVSIKKKSTKGKK